MRTKIIAIQSFKNLRGRLLIGIAVVCMLAVSGLRADEAQEAPVMGGLLQQTNVDSRLWGEWTLESVEFKIGNNTQRLQVEALLNNPAVKALVGSFIDDRYFSILFHENEVGLDLKNPTNNFDRPLKGTYSAANDKLTLPLYDQTPRTFNYSVNGENLSIIYMQGSSRLSLIFKLTIRY